MHLYIHVPFCARRCSYCDFAIAVRREVPSREYADLVLREWQAWQAHPAWHRSPGIETVYFGGGTPSRLDPAAVGRILEGIGSERALAPGAEVTLEANPDDVTAPAARAWRSAGVNRVSLGVQSFEPAVLEWMHRTHQTAQVPAAVDLLREAGIEDLSLDLIFGLPRALGRAWEADLGRAFALAPTHLSLYGLTIEPHTPLGRWVERGAVAPVDEETYAEEYLAAHRALEAHGYEHYEVSNAARPGYQARHNSAYWRRAPFIGLGPGAHSGLGRERRWNLREWEAYRTAAQAGAPLCQGGETLDEDARTLERMYLGLRTREGLPARDVPEEVRRRWVDAGWAEEGQGRLALTAEGWLRLDSLVAAL